MRNRLPSISRRRNMYESGDWSPIPKRKPGLRKKLQTDPGLSGCEAQLSLPPKRQSEHPGHWYLILSAHSPCTDALLCSAGHRHQGRRRVWSRWESALSQPGFAQQIHGVEEFYLNQPPHQPPGPEHTKPSASITVTSKEGVYLSFARIARCC